MGYYMVLWGKGEGVVENEEEMENRPIDEKAQNMVSDFLRFWWSGLRRTMR